MSETTFNDLGTRIAEVVAREFGLGTNHGLTPQSTFHEMGVDSLDMVELAIGIEEVFDVDIPDVYLNKITTMADLVEYIEKNIRADVRSQPCSTPA